jgi:hypothetical protein
VYGLEDLHDLLEVLSVESINKAAMQRKAELDARADAAERRGSGR